VNWREQTNTLTEGFHQSFLPSCGRFVGNSSTKPVMEESPVVRSQSEASINGAFNYSQRDLGSHE